MTRSRESIAAALSVLGCDHPAIARAVSEIGVPEPRVLEPGFAALIRIIVGQQVSTSAASAILGRLETAGGLDPDRFATFGDEDLAAIGFSRAKIRYGRALASRILDRSLNLDALSANPPEDVQATLLSVPGIGRWSAEIYRMFALGDADVFPAGDLALREGVRLLLDLPDRPDVQRTDAFAESWRPYRSAAALLLWRLYRVRRGIAVLGADNGS